MESAKLWKDLEEKSLTLSEVRLNFDKKRAFLDKFRLLKSHEVMEKRIRLKKWKLQLEREKRTEMHRKQENDGINGRHAE